MRAMSTLREAEQHREEMMREMAKEQLHQHKRVSLFPASFPVPIRTTRANVLPAPSFEELVPALPSPPHHVANLRPNALRPLMKPGKPHASLMRPNALHKLLPAVNKKPSNLRPNALRPLMKPGKPHASLMRPNAFKPLIKPTQQPSNNLRPNAFKPLFKPSNTQHHSDNLRPNAFKPLIKPNQQPTNRPAVLQHYARTVPAFRGYRSGYHVYDVCAPVHYLPSKGEYQVAITLQARRPVGSLVWTYLPSSEDGEVEVFSSTTTPTISTYSRINPQAATVSLRVYVQAPLSSAAITLTSTTGWKQVTPALCVRQPLSSFARPLAYARLSFLPLFVLFILIALIASCCRRRRRRCQTTDNNADHYPGHPLEPVETKDTSYMSQFSQPPPPPPRSVVVYSDVPPPTYDSLPPAIYSKGN